jgi:Skp family chaperone for outer membrane proteins
MTIVILAVSVVLAGPAWAQAPAQTPAQTPPAGQQPPAQTPPATPPAAAAKQEPPKPFPEGAKIAYVNLNLVAQNSNEGKAASSKIQDFLKKKNAELADKQKALQGLQGKLQQGASVMSDQARAQLEKDITRQSRELQIAQEDAQTEQQQLTQQLQNEFQDKLLPIIDQIANEKSLHMVFSADGGPIWADRGLDLSAEVIKRLDAGAKTPATKK